jgi:nicotinate-nucleotide pyrophosphorylase (carboxylating)
MVVATRARELDASAVERLVRSTLAEDVGLGDVTTEATVDAAATCEARLLLKEPGVVCGLPVAEAVFRALDPDVRFERLVADGEALSETGAIARLSGSARAVLTGERTALNFVGRLTGIATLTRRFVEAVAGTDCAILDTRKTTPGLRVLEKYAVRCGGGRNHRFGLDDGILVKDNHLRAAGGIRAAVDRLRAAGTELPIEVEAETHDDVREALAAGAHTILLDNMTPAAMREAVTLAAGRALFEASGGVSLETVREIAETGVDFVSVGALTHSARSLDVSLEVQ